jgi:hypothetical protein
MATLRLKLTKILSNRKMENSSEMNKNRMPTILTCSKCKLNFSYYLNYSAASIPLSTLEILRVYEPKIREVKNYGEIMSLSSTAFSIFSCTELFWKIIDELE